MTAIGRLNLVEDLEQRGIRAVLDQAIVDLDDQELDVLAELLGLSHGGWDLDLALVLEDWLATQVANHRGDGIRVVLLSSCEVAEPAAAQSLRCHLVVVACVELLDEGLLQALHVTRWDGGLGSAGVEAGVLAGGFTGAAAFHAATHATPTHATPPALALTPTLTSTFAHTSAVTRGLARGLTSTLSGTVRHRDSLVWVLALRGLRRIACSAAGILGLAFTLAAGPAGSLGSGCVCRSFRKRTASICAGELGQEGGLLGRVEIGEERDAGCAAEADFIALVSDRWCRGAGRQACNGACLVE